jgi:hypothetical protein
MEEMVVLPRCYFGLNTVDTVLKPKSVMAFTADNSDLEKHSASFILNEAIRVYDFVEPNTSIAVTNHHMVPRQ